MKHIKKSILLATALFVTTGLTANDNYNKYKEHHEYNHKEYKKHHGYNHHNKKERRSHRGDMSRYVIGAVYDLQLTKEQIKKIDTIITQFKNERFDRFKGFTKEGFDKNAYIEARTKTKEDRIKEKAELLQDIYSNLNSAQIEHLNRKIEKFKQRKMKREKNDKSCNDRR